MKRQHNPNPVKSSRIGQQNILQNMRCNPPHHHVHHQFHIVNYSPGSTQCSPQDNPSSHVPLLALRSLKCHERKTSPVVKRNPKHYQTETGVHPKGRYKRATNNEMTHCLGGCLAQGILIRCTFPCYKMIHIHC